MTYWLPLTLSILFGGLLGLGYFGGLWWTVRRVRNVEGSTALLLGSFLVRSVFALGGFYLILRWMDGHWEMVALSLLGFLGVRLVLVRRWGPETVLSSSPNPHSNLQDVPAGRLPDNGN